MGSSLCSSTQRWQVWELGPPQSLSEGRGAGAGLKEAHLTASNDPTAKVQEELDATVGRTRAPRLEDRAHLPYTNAVLHEIQRFISVLPLGLPRALTRDTHFRNHFLHKVPGSLGILHWGNGV